MRPIHRIAPCLWFNDQAEEAISFYTSILVHSTVGSVVRYGRAGNEIHGRPPGSAMTIKFKLDGYPFTALNGGPIFKFNEPISPQIYCET
jgi:predicted 3-demethylubiquinone-9 3-methyltransferase (glyoxalase superfamily)